MAWPQTPTASAPFTPNSAGAFGKVATPPPQGFGGFGTPALGQQAAPGFGGFGTPQQAPGSAQKTGFMTALGQPAGAPQAASPSFGFGTPVKPPAAFGAAPGAFGFGSPAPAAAAVGVGASPGGFGSFGLASKPPGAPAPLAPLGATGFGFGGGFGGAAAAPPQGQLGQPGAPGALAAASSAGGGGVVVCGVLGASGPALAEGAHVVEAPPKFRRNSALKDLEPLDALVAHADDARKLQWEHQEAMKSVNRTLAQLQESLPELHRRCAHVQASVRRAHERYSAAAANAGVLSHHHHYHHATGQTKTSGALMGAAGLSAQAGTQQGLFSEIAWGEAVAGEALGVSAARARLGGLSSAERKREAMNSKNALNALNSEAPHRFFWDLLQRLEAKYGGVAAQVTTLKQLSDARRTGGGDGCGGYGQQRALPPSVIADVIVAQNLHIAALAEKLAGLHARVDTLRTHALQPGGIDPFKDADRHERVRREHEDRLLRTTPNNGQGGGDAAGQPQAANTATAVAAAAPLGGGFGFGFGSPGAATAGLGPAAAPGLGLTGVGAGLGFGAAKSPAAAGGFGAGPLGAPPPLKPGFGGAVSPSVGGFAMPGAAPADPNIIASRRKVTTNKNKNKGFF